MSDQELGYRLRNAEQLIQRLQQDSDNQKKEYDAKLEEVQSKVNTLETTKAVLVVVAAIFGLAGAWGAATLRAAQGRISALQVSIADTQGRVEKLQRGTQAIYDAENSAVVEAKSSIQNAEREAVEQALSQFASKMPSITRMQCEIQRVYDMAYYTHDDVQILLKSTEAETEFNQWKASVTNSRLGAPNPADSVESLCQRADAKNKE